MRIWAFPTIYPYKHSGSKSHGIFAHRQYKALIKSGAELQVVIPILWNPPFPFYLLHKEWKQYAAMEYPAKRIYDGVTVHHPRISNIKPNRLEKKSYIERYIESVVTFFKDNNIVLDPANDIFFSQWLPEGATAQMAAHRLGLKSALLSIGDDVVVEPYRSEAHRQHFVKAVTEADWNLTVADYLGRETNKIVGKTLDYDVVHMGADYNNFKPGTPEEVAQIKKEYGIPADKIILLNAGSAIVRKGWIDIFDALKEIKKTNDNFAIVGVYGGPYDINVAEEAAKRGLADNFIDIGEVVPEKLNALYKAGDIFCLPSHWEGIAVAVMESMATGMAVLTTNVCGHPELVTDDVTGILIPPKRVDLLTEKLRLLISDAELRQRLGRNAREFMMKEWGSYDDIAVRLYKLLQDGLKK